MTSDVPRPKLSVLTIGYGSASECLFVLEQLRRQTARSVLEVIVIAPNRDGIDPAALDDFGADQWLIVPTIHACGETMDTGVRAARAPFVTYAEEHATLDPRWAEALLAAHDRGHDVVGFAMENANPATLTSWAHLYGQFGPVVAPVPTGERDALGAHHVSYRRELLLAYGDQLADMLEDENALFLDLRSKGTPMFVAGDAISGHANISDLGAYIHYEFLGQRSFASTRAKTGRWPWWKRGAFAAAGPLIPWVRMRRIVSDIVRTGRQRELLPRVLGPIGLALLAGACGEMLGYLVGGGNTAARRAPVELQREKSLARKDPWSKAARE